MKFKLHYRVYMVLALVAASCGGGGNDAADGGTEEPAADVSAGGSTADEAIPEAPEMVYASHILIPFEGCTQAPPDAMERDSAFELLSSVADSIEKGLLTFEEAAGKYSSCPSSRQGGFLGGFQKGQMVPEFEDVVFNMPEGTFSDVFETEYGFHVVYREPAIRVSHILIAWQGAERSTVARSREEALELVESIRDSLSSGTLTFAEAAEKYSDCPSGMNGGDLGPFSRHVMTPAFEDAAFDLEVGETSGIVETPFGYHLIRRTE